MCDAWVEADKDRQKAVIGQKTREELTNTAEITIQKTGVEPVLQRSNLSRR